MKEPQEKLTIKNFAHLVKRNESTIRYYESKSLLKPKRDQYGRRYFTAADVEWFKFLIHIKGTGMSIKEMQQYVLWRAEGENTISLRRELLEKTREEFIEKYNEIEHHLQVLDDKINWYRSKENGSDKSNEPFADYLKRIGHPAP